MLGHRCRRRDWRVRRRLARRGGGGTAALVLLLLLALLLANLQALPLLLLLDLAAQVERELADEEAHVRVLGGELDRLVGLAVDRSVGLQHREIRRRLALSKLALELRRAVVLREDVEVVVGPVVCPLGVGHVLQVRVEVPGLAPCSVGLHVRHAAANRLQVVRSVLHALVAPLHFVEQVAEELLRVGRQRGQLREHGDALDLGGMLQRVAAPGCRDFLKLYQVLRGRDLGMDHRVAAAAGQGGTPEHESTRAEAAAEVGGTNKAHDSEPVS